VLIVQAAQLMAAKRADAVLAVNSDGQLSGILTDKDIAYRVVAEGLGSFPFFYMFVCDIAICASQSDTHTKRYVEWSRSDKKSSIIRCRNTKKTSDKHQLRK
jgi:hypothetical protein